MRQTRTEEFEAKSEECQLRKHQYTMTLFDCNHLAHVIVIWQIQLFRDCFVLLCIREQFASTSPRGLIFAGAI